jgi:hypothetical protein
VRRGEEGSGKGEGGMVKGVEEWMGSGKEGGINPWLPHPLPHNPSPSLNLLGCLLMLNNTSLLKFQNFKISKLNI